MLWTRVRFPSGPLKLNIINNGMVYCESDIQCRYFCAIIAFETFRGEFNTNNGGIIKK